MIVSCGLAVIIVLPISVVRWIQFTQPHRDIPSEAIAFVAIVYNLSGFINVLLYISTHRRRLFGSNSNGSGGGIPQTTTKSGTTGVGNGDVGDGTQTYEMQLPRFTDFDNMSETGTQTENSQAEEV